MPQLTITLDDDLLQAAQAYARQQGQEVDKLVADLLQACRAASRSAIVPAPKCALAYWCDQLAHRQLPPDFDYKQAVEEAIWG
ncbi:MAG: DUF6364 family protein [Hymenobacter sp.]